MKSFIKRLFRLDPSVNELWIYRDWVYAKNWGYSYIYKVTKIYDSRVYFVTMNVEGARLESSLTIKEFKQQFRLF